MIQSLRDRLQPLRELPLRLEQIDSLIRSPTRCNGLSKVPTRQGRRSTKR